jgi:hypothetical protein
MLAWLMLVAVAWGQTTFVLSGVKDGVYVLRVVGGQATLTPAVEIGTTPISPKPPTPPAPPIPPKPAPTLQSKSTELGEQVADPTRKNTAQAIAAVYRETSKLVQENGLKAEAYPTATNMMYGPMLGNLGKKEAWKAWKSGIDQAVAAAGLSSVADYAKAWEEIAAGLDAIKEEAVVAPAPEEKPLP